MIRARAPALEIDGEMHADAALVEAIRDRAVPDSRLHGTANLLVMPSLDAANIAFNLLKAAADGLPVGPMLLGMSQADPRAGAQRHRARHRQPERAGGRWRRRAQAQLAPTALREATARTEAMLWLVLGGLTLFLFLGGLRAFERLGHHDQVAVGLDRGAGRPQPGAAAGADRPRRHRPGRAGHVRAADLEPLARRASAPGWGRRARRRHSGGGSRRPPRRRADAHDPEEAYQVLGLAPAPARPTSAPRITG